jgi:hypothetical protein
MAQEADEHTEGGDALVPAQAAEHGEECHQQGQHAQQGEKQQNEHLGQGHG